jgi:hypothetical protein
MDTERFTTPRAACCITRQVDNDQSHNVIYAHDLSSISADEFDFDSSSALFSPRKEAV